MEENENEKVAYLMTKKQAQKISLFAAIGGMVIGSIGHGKGQVRGNKTLGETLMLAQVVALQEAMMMTKMGHEEAKTFEKSVMEIIYELGGKDLAKDGLRELDFTDFDDEEDKGDDWKGGL